MMMMENVITIILVIIIVLIAYFHQKKLRRQSLGQTQPPTVAIFHPWCNDGGGGERVLWAMIEGLTSTLISTKLKIYVYTDGILDKDTLLEQINRQFDLKINGDDVMLVPVRFCKYLKPNCYPMFTLLLQNLASIIVAINAAYHLEPDIYIDTTGFAFTYPIFKLFCFSKIVTYVHYPTITSDMIQVVVQRKSSFNNNELIARIALLTKIKLIYYNLFSYLYYWCGRCTDIVMVNGRWTREHIETLWFNNKESINENLLYTVYPPCGIDSLSDVINESNPIKPTRRKPIILSLGQFRPEKDHKSQLFIFKKILDTLKDDPIANELMLYIIGGCRNYADYNLLDNLVQMTVDLGIEKQVEFLSNISSIELKNLLDTSLIGIHTMKDEHFGIGIVEMAVSGLIVVAHKSGGPLFDIIKTDSPSIEIGSVGYTTGFLAESINEYVLHLSTILSMSQNDLQHVRYNAFVDMKSRFSDNIFKNNVVNCLNKILL